MKIQDDAVGGHGMGNDQYSYDYNFFFFLPVLLFCYLSDDHCMGCFGLQDKQVLD